MDDDAPTRAILLAGGGGFECAHITMTQGIHVADAAMPPGACMTALSKPVRSQGQTIPESGWDQPRHELAKALGRPVDMN